MSLISFIRFSFGETKRSSPTRICTPLCDLVFSLRYTGTRPGEPLSLGEWMTKQTREIGFAFGSSNGGGAHNTDGNTGGIPAGVKELRNPTAHQLGEYAKEIRSGKMMIVNE